MYSSYFSLILEKLNISEEFTKKYSKEQIMMVVVIYGLELKQENIVSNIAHSLSNTMPTVSVALKKLEKQGIIDRETDKENRRRTYVRLTNKTEIKKIYDQIQEILKEVKSKFNEQEMKIIDKYIEELLAMASNK